MDISGERRPSHKEWRRKVKKERRKRLRCKAAQDRDADAERLRAALEKTAEYSSWIKEQEDKKRQEEIIQEQELIEKEQEWLEQELRAQEEWRALQERREKARQAQLEQEEMIRKEYEAKQEVLRKKQEEEKRRREEELKKHEELQKQINDYIDNGAKTPEVLRTVVETQSGKAEICQFYLKTGACRYGDMCSRNHLKMSLSKVILIPGFYSHYSLENNAVDRETDAGLEYDNAEMRQHFKEFYKDVVPELESFGKIKTLQFCCNNEPHLRGNLYVEYYTERDAARALRKLKGRWFARRQLNCEFTGIKSWRTAICGMSRCPKGRFCNFLHVFRNPNNEYNVKSPPRWIKRLEGQDSYRKESSRRSENRHKSNWDDSTRGDMDNNSRNWRWDSPDPEPEDRKGESIRRRYPEDRYQTSRRSNYASSRRSRNLDESRSSRDFEDFSDEEYHSKHYRNSSVRSRRHDDEYRNGDSDSRHRRSDYERYSSRSGNHSYHYRNDRDRHRKRSHERARSKERVSSKIEEKDSKSSRTSGGEDLKSSKSKADGKVKSKWDEDTSTPKVESDSSSSSSSSPASSSSSSSRSSSSSQTKKGANDEPLEPEPEPKRQKVTVPEHYEWDTTESEDDEKK